MEFPVNEPKKEALQRAQASFDIAPVDYMIRLKELVGTGAGACELIGLSSAAYNKAVAEGQTRRVNELAAKAAYLELVEESIYIIRLSNDDVLSTLQAHSKALGFTLTKIKL